MYYCPEKRRYAYMSMRNVCGNKNSTCKLYAECMRNACGGVCDTSNEIRLAPLQPRHPKAPKKVPQKDPNVPMRSNRGR